MDDARLEDLLLRWEELAEAGRDVSAEELCRECPELTEELAQRIRALQRVGWLSERLDQPPLVSQFTLLAPGSEPVPGYRLMSRLGRGGFAEVWKADGPNGPVALKFIPQGERAAQVERRSLAVLRQLEHPNLLRTYETWQIAEFFVLAMELADGTLLDRDHEARSQGLPGIPREELLRYFREAADGIDFLQKRYIQHRDVKPQNLLLVGGRVKVGDFGLARLLANSVTGHTGSLTLAYAAPEFFEGRTTRQSDQYSLAVTYCQMRGGKLPFTGTPAAMVAAHLHRRPDLAMLPAEERPAVAKALSKRPAERWPACRDFVAAVANPSATGSLQARGRSRRRLLLAGLAFLTPGLALLPAVFRRRPDPPSGPRVGGDVRGFELPRHPFLIRNVAVAEVPDLQNKVVALSNGTKPILWDVATGKILRQFDKLEHGGPGAALAPWGVPLGVTGGEDASVILWDLAAWQEVRRFKGHTSSVSSVAFSPDGRQILTGSCDATVRLFDRKTAREIHCLRGHDSFVMSVAFDQTGRRALSGGFDKRVCVWNLDTGKQTARFDGHKSQVWCVACSWDGRHGISGGLDKVVRLWNLNNGREVRHFEGHTKLVTAVTFRGQDQVISAGDETIRVWNYHTGRELYRSPQQLSEIRGGALAAFGGHTSVVVGTEADGLRLWQIPEE